ncbi:MAG TPA: APC family permease [Microbacterium sp.]|uniref:APC family permease n=1 Tax=Microbacterium sp. TaxID=51671 RepID=UPI002B4853E8|nr:APC family permease [Microbacterium sp.]HKT57147.1 APC family permease [Microbacterium sp.]
MLPSATTTMSVQRPVTDAPHPPRRIGVFSLIMMIVAASAPLTVVAGGVTANFAVSGQIGVPLSFVVLGIVLALFAVGYAALSTKVSTAGAFYSYVARGLGRVPGVGSAWLALIAYNTMQIGIYGMFGYAASDLIHSLFGASVPWWITALVGWLIVGLLGVNAVDLSAKVLAVLVSLEFLVVIVYDVLALHTAPEGISFAGLRFQDLFGPSAGAILAFSVAAFMGFESGAIYVDEVKNPATTVRRATYGAVGVIAAFYAFSAWAMVMGAGPSQVVKLSQTEGPGVVFGMLAATLPKAMVDMAQFLFVTSLLAALVSFHNVVARYFRSLSRERALPSYLSISRGRGHAPVAASLTQSALALAVLVVFAVAGAGAADPVMFPVVTLFTWLTNMGALGLVALMALTSVAAIGYLRRHPDGRSLWTRWIAPGTAAVSLSVLTIVIILNFSVLVGLDQGNVLNWLLPCIVVIPGIAGLIWAAWLKRARPSVYAGIGHGGGDEVDR